MSGRCQFQNSRTAPAICSYCRQSFDVRITWDSKPSRSTCSPECAKRSAAWVRWIREARTAAIFGTVRKPPKSPKLSAAGVSEAIAPFAMSDDSQLDLAV